MNILLEFYLVLKVRGLKFDGKFIFEKINFLFYSLEVNIDYVSLELKFRKKIDKLLNVFIN